MSGCCSSKHGGAWSSLYLGAFVDPHFACASAVPVEDPGSCGDGNDGCAATDMDVASIESSLLMSQLVWSIKEVR